MYLNDMHGILLSAINSREYKDSMYCLVLYCKNNILNLQIIFTYFL